jgi:hypothetical protein
MNDQRNEFGDLMNRMARSLHEGSVADLLHQLRKALDARAEIQSVEPLMAKFVMSLDTMRLRGVQDMPCLLITGDGAELPEVARRFRTQTIAPGTIPVFLALTQAAHERIRRDVPTSGCLLLSAAQMERIANDAEPRGQLKRFLWDQMPKRTFIPYDCTHPAEESVFEGRRPEIERLTYDTHKSFALAGPGLIGKSSVVRQYLRQMRRQHPEDANRRVYVDCNSFGNLDPDEFARRIALKISSSKRAGQTTADTLLGFFGYERFMTGSPVELILDEVDEVCNNVAFRALGASVMDKTCRLILCGKRNLFRALFDPRWPLNGRVELMRLHPLDVPDARRLVTEPMAELGIALPSDKSHIADMILGLTGRLPYLIQVLCQRLAENAIQAGRSSVSERDVNEAMETPETWLRFTAPLENPATSEERLVAHALLQNPQDFYTIAMVDEIVQREGVALPLERIQAVCDDLVISNVLAWRHGGLSLANGALVEFARRQGIARSGLRQAVEAIRAERRLAAPVYR